MNNGLKEQAKVQGDRVVDLKEHLQKGLYGGSMGIQICNSAFAQMIFAIKEEEVCMRFTNPNSSAC